MSIRSALRARGRDAYRLVATGFGWGAIILGSILWGAIAIPPTLLLSRIWPGVRERFNDGSRLLLAIYVRTLLYARVEVTGAEKRVREARILVANHQSFLDPLFLMSLEPQLGGPVRRYMDRIPIFRSILRLSGFYFSEVGEFPSLEEMGRAARDAKERGGGLLFFPEGTRSRTGEVGTFHRGAFRTAVDYSLPIQPVVIDGLDRVLPPGRIVVKEFGRFPIRIRYLEPLWPPYGVGVRRDVVRALTERVRCNLIEELERSRAERGVGISPASRRPRGENPGAAPSR